MIGNILSQTVNHHTKEAHQGGDSVDSYETKVIDGKLYVNLVPTTLGKRVTELH
jgi:hypothetical protein